MEWLQYIMVAICVVAAAFFLLRKYVFKSSKSDKACGNDDCGCH